MAPQKFDRPVFTPHPEEIDDVRRGLEDPPVDDATSAAFMKWLETGEGPCPVSQR